MIEEADEETELSPKPQDQPQCSSFIGHTLESSFDALVSPGAAAGDYLIQGASDGSNGQVIGGPKPHPASRIDRKGSLLSRLGNSIRKKLRRLSGDAAAEAFEEFKGLRRSSGRSRHNSIGEPSAAALTDDLAVSSGAIEATEHSIMEEADSPFGSPARRPLHHPQHQRRNRSYRKRGESAETDSGIGKQLEKTISMDEDTDSSKRSNSGRSKRNSYKRTMAVTALTASSSGLPATTTTVTTLVDTCDVIVSSGGAASSSVDAGFVDAQTAVNELETLLQSQGLEPVEFSRSTLV